MNHAVQVFGTSRILFWARKYWWRFRPHRFLPDILLIYRWNGANYGGVAGSRLAICLRLTASFMSPKPLIEFIVFPIQKFKRPFIARCFSPSKRCFTEQTSDIQEHGSYRRSISRLSRKRSLTIAMILAWRKLVSYQAELLP